MLYLVEHFYYHCYTALERVQSPTLTLGFTQRKAQQATLFLEQNVISS
jgi:hypothetical protein